MDPQDHGVVQSPPSPPTDPTQQEINALLKAVTEIELALTPALKQDLLTSSAVSTQPPTPPQNPDPWSSNSTQPATPTQKFSVIDSNTGIEILSVFDLSPGGQGLSRDGDNRVFAVTLPRPTTQTESHMLLHVGYVFKIRQPLPALELSTPSGAPLGLLERTSCVCCCFCDEATLRNPKTGGPLLNVCFHPYCGRNVEVSRPSKMGGKLLGKIDLPSSKASILHFDGKADSYEKFLILGIAVGMVDFNQLHSSLRGLRNNKRRGREM